MVLTSVSVGFLVHLNERERFNQSEELAGGPIARRNVRHLSTLLRNGGEPALKAFLQDKSFKRFPILVVDAQDQDILGRPVPAEALKRARHFSQSRNTRPHPQFAHQVKTPSGEQYLLFAPRPPEHHKPLVKFSVLRWSLLVGIGLVFSLALTWYLVRPIRLLQQAAKSAAGGDLQTRVSPTLSGRKDEMAALAKDFDDMVQQLSNLLNGQKQLLHDVSHELRSPLARMQVALELIHQQPEKKAELLQRLNLESQRIDHLVGELLTLSRMESGIEDPTRFNIDLQQWLPQCIADVEFEHQSDCHIEWHNHLSDTRAYIFANENLLRSVVENILRNALQHTHAGTLVKVSLSQTQLELSDTHHDMTPQKAYTIEICDQGDGVKPENLDKLFQAFFRENPQTNKLGYGLGLAIAKRGIESLGGVIQAKNREEGGLCLSMSIPALPHENSI